MSRRGEVPFVAMRVGRSNDPREVLGLAADLKVSRAEALGYVCLWEEMILEVGDAMTGRLAGYDAGHLAVKLGWKGTPARLVAALKKAGLLAVQRHTLRHAYWKDSTTGDYAINRAERREDDRLRKAEARAAAARAAAGVRDSDVPGMSNGHPPDVQETSYGSPDIKKGRESGQPPQPPADGGGSSGASRWRWVLKHHKRPMNPEACTRILEGVSDEDWALIQWICGLPAGGGGLIPLWKKRVLKADTYKLLAKGAFLQIRPEWEEKLGQDRRGAERRAVPREVATPERELEREQTEKIARAASAAPFILAQLADPKLTEAEREKVRARWRAAHPDVPPPWEEIPAN